MESGELASRPPDRDPHAPAAGRPAFFPVSATKLAVMSICTFGWYQVYWFYENWHLVKRRERSRISPPWRSVLGLFFCYPMFRRIGTAARELALPGPPALALFLAWLLVSVLGYGPARYAALSLGSVLCLLPVQRAANRINARVAPAHDRNHRFSGWNIAAVVIGGVLVLLVVGAVLIALVTGTVIQKL